MLTLFKIVYFPVEFDLEIEFNDVIGRESDTGNLDELPPVRVL